MTQSQAEKERILELGEDGRIFCLDLSHHDGQTLAITLAHYFPEVGAELRQRTNNRQYMLVLIAKSRPKPAVVLTNRHDLVDAFNKLYEESKHYGNAFVIVDAPSNNKIQALVAELQPAHGHA
jgi:hypothetical protein